MPVCSLFVNRQKGKTAMKKKALLMPLLLGAALLAGCADNGESGGDSSSYSDPNASLWSESDKALMEEYCGSILPYPSMLTGEVKVEEIDDGGDKYLAITNIASSFSMENYYTVLEEAGWTAITSYTGEKVQSKSGTSYVELVRSDGGKGYDLTYYYLESEEKGSSYNCLICRNSYTGQARGDKDWSDEDKKVISYVVEDKVVPFIALGEDYGLYAASLNTLYAYDYYAKDVSLPYCRLLMDNGFTVNKTSSISSGDYYLYRKYDDGSRIDIKIDYFNGNNIYFYYTPNVTAYAEWPTDLTKEAIEKSGNDIPSFGIKEGGSYLTYSKNGVTYIYSYDYSSTFDYESYWNSIYDPLYCWNEKLSVDASFIGSDDEDPEGFLIYFSLSEPTSAFFSSWSEAKVEEGIKESLGFEGIEIPSIDLSSLSSKSKYVINIEEDHQEVYEYYYNAYKSDYGSTMSDEDIASIANDYADLYCPVGMIVSFYDEKKDTQSDFITAYKVFSGYKEALYKAGWYLMDDTGGSTYEDPSGKLSVKVTYSGGSSGNNVCTKISFLKGSGEAHSPVFEFEKEAYEVGEGSNVNLTLNVKMLPYEVTYSSSDPNIINVTPAGKAICKTDAKAGDEVTITASAKDSDGHSYSASCKVKVVKGENYKTMMGKVEDALKKEGYGDYSEEDIISSAGKAYGKRLIVSLGKDISIEEAKTLVNEKLIIDGYTVYSWRKYVKDEDYSSSSSLANKPVTLRKGNGTPSIDGSDAETLECWLKNDFLYLKMAYYVYTSSSGETMLIVESTTFR